MTNPSPPQTSAQTSPSRQQGPFVLTKVSRAGRRYFFNGTLTCVETENCSAALVAETSFEQQDAFQYSSTDLPAAIAKLLNKQGIGGVPWTVAPFQSQQFAQRALS